MNNKPNLLTSEEAADYIHVAPDTLAVWRCTGRHNIPYIKTGRKVLYDENDLLDFIKKRTMQREEAYND